MTQERVAANLAAAAPHPVERLVASATYKPRHHMEVVDPYVTFGVAKLLRVVLSVEDATGEREGLIEVAHSFPIPPASAMPDDYWQEWILGCADAAERHETCEWLKFDGVAPFDPHREKQT